MNSEQLATEIRDLNLSYLVLAQSMIRKDKSQALFRLGISESAAELLLSLSTQQLLRVASRNQMLCTMRFGDDVVWGLLTDSHAPHQAPEANAGRLHASVLMAGRTALQAA
ncbi:flagellar transcriptional regulator FlhD [Ramlibacter alkalitolerans]|uniref:Flagellar transcriptional regulator FlhD n=1 Tax=Ramlibacter alkalitolerans TaxID=2039631 RepID=A0ABS1JLU8_9BURK|nr:flagellar transcriptional regulator FlhD [Ramlibacter alkalitolerans]MBL0424876.1 flagellar transcriptional regulator FlhD [Ramlibacter alkalitolerans]